ncbi:hypothetical protein CEUSTIGMA_g12896.t1 [Chlamydomonas eustigma]|uniref:Uncharacterized protein n=1 Tax=Chlamydomonas eustigma TaxID=1157962 RepID=A0A250XRP8_9CHLO|nr:hypothetical protein CEUSTIGMA_g12896.t1 [Chlamydomonas eustigma]|eukprot:GAX85480.1 hypothetical protein CEUSTIGMA_g12896.t1 [Chlamydomonas eustigma]
MVAENNIDVDVQLMDDIQEELPAEDIRIDTGMIVDVIDVSKDEELSAAPSEFKSKLEKNSLLWDNAPEGSTVSCQGVGRKVKETEKGICMAAVIEFIKANETPGWTDAHVKTAFNSRRGAEGVLLYDRIQIIGHKFCSICSARNMSSKARVNQFIVQNYEGNGPQSGHYVGEIQCFLKIPRHVDSPTSSGNAGIPPLRLPIVKFYSKPKKHASGNLWEVNTQSVLQRSAFYAVEPLSIMGKVVVAYPKGEEGVVLLTYSY